MDEDYIARSAQLALLLEVSAYPKPGNVDRTHNFRDTSYEHFIASSVAVYPVLREAAVGDRGVGELVRMGVEESMLWQRGGNTHFGALLLLMPLAMAAGACERADLQTLKKKALEIMQNFKNFENSMGIKQDLLQLIPQKRYAINGLQKETTAHKPQNFQNEEMIMNEH